MSLSSGTRLGPYEIVAPLGAGGMGEVYRAKDTKLDREVAIKVLPESFAADVDRVARFTREAKTLASLNHPNIAAIYGIEDNAIVMELVEGEDLSAHITRGAIALPEALPIARQIADALEAAHEQGIVHRDLKPQNIKVRADGTVKVLDFGLAKAMDPASTSSSDLANSPTMTSPAMTGMGMILGTAAYMSPEQARGKAVDKRADIWAFGVVLYEMLSGRRAFEGEEISDVLAAALRADIDFAALPSSTPPRLRELLARCLDRDLKTRLRDIGEARVVLSGPLAPALPNTSSAAPSSSRWAWGIAASLFVTTLIGFGLWWRTSPAPQLPVVLTVDAPEGATATMNTAGASSSSMAMSEISPDGRTLAFLARTASGRAFQLYVRPMDSLVARLVPGTDGASAEFWSPDSKSIAFFADNKLKRVDLAGGTPVTVCDMPSQGRGGSWSDAGVMLFTWQDAEGLYQVPASGGTPALVTHRNQSAGETQHYFPQFLPGGRAFLYRVGNRDTAKHGVAVGSLDQPSTTTSTVFLVTNNDARYDAASGKLLFIDGADALKAQTLALDPPRLVGNPVTVAEGVVAYTSTTRHADFSVSRTGTLAYLRALALPQVRFTWRDRAGRLLEAIGEPVDAGRAFALSPDGTRVAYYAGRADAESDVWVMDLKSGLRTRVSFNRGMWPQWSPDGKAVYYSSPSGFVRRSSDGSGDEVLIAKAPQTDHVWAVLPDGKTLLVGNAGIDRLDLTGQRATLVSRANMAKVSATVTTDGRWMAYASWESGREEIYVQDYPDRRGKWLISSSGGETPRWRADGKELFWAGLDGKLMAAKIDVVGDRLSHGQPQALFDLPVSGSRQRFGVFLDGQRLLVIDPETRQLPQSTIVVMLNWAAGLKK